MLCNKQTIIPDILYYTKAPIICIKQMFGQTIKAQTVMAVSIYKKITKLSIFNKDN